MLVPCGFLVFGLLFLAVAVLIRNYGEMYSYYDRCDLWSHKESDRDGRCLCNLSH